MGLVALDYLSIWQIEHFLFKEHPWHLCMSLSIKYFCAKMTHLQSKHTESSKYIVKSTDNLFHYYTQYISWSYIVQLMPCFEDLWPFFALHHGFQLFEFVFIYGFSVHSWYAQIPEFCLVVPKTECKVPTTNGNIRIQIELFYDQNAID